jgi:hypothetical protein
MKVCSAALLARLSSTIIRREVGLGVGDGLGVGVGDGLGVRSIYWFTNTRIRTPSNKTVTIPAALFIDVSH